MLALTLSEIEEIRNNVKTILNKSSQDNTDLTVAIARLKIEIKRITDKETYDSVDIQNLATIYGTYCFSQEQELKTLCQSALTALRNEKLKNGINPDDIKYISSTRNAVLFNVLALSGIKMPNADDTGKPIYFDSFMYDRDYRYFAPSNSGEESTISMLYKAGLIAKDLNPDGNNLDYLQSNIAALTKKANQLLSKERKIDFLTDLIESNPNKLDKVLYDLHLATTIDSLMRDSENFNIETLDGDQIDRFFNAAQAYIDARALKTFDKPQDDLNDWMGREAATSKRLLKKAFSSSMDPLFDPSASPDTLREELRKFLELVEISPKIKSAFDGLSENISNKQPVLVSIRQTVMTAHAFGIEGLSNFTSGDARISFNLGGFTVENTLPHLSQSIEEFKKIDSDGLSRDEKKLLGEVMAAFDASSKAIIEKDYTELARAYKKNEPVILPVEWEGHAASSVLYKGKLYVANKGANTTVPSIKVYSFDDSYLSAKTLPEVTNFIKRAAEFQRPASRLPQAIADSAVGQVIGIFLPTSGVRQGPLAELGLKLEKVERINGQKVGNCSYTNTKRAAECVMKALVDDKPEYKDVNVRELYTKFSKHDRQFALDKYLTILSEQKNKASSQSDKDAIDAIAKSTLIQVLREKNEKHKTDMGSSIKDKLMNNYNMSEQDIARQVLSSPQTRSQLAFRFLRRFEQTVFGPNRDKAVADLMTFIVPGGKKAREDRFLTSIGIEQSKINLIRSDLASGNNAKVTLLADDTSKLNIDSKEEQGKAEKSTESKQAESEKTYDFSKEIYKNPTFTEALKKYNDLLAESGSNFQELNMVRNELKKVIENSNEYQKNGNGFFPELMKYIEKEYPAVNQDIQKRLKATPEERLYEKKAILQEKWGELVIKEFNKLLFELDRDPLIESSVNKTTANFIRALKNSEPYQSKNSKPDSLNISEREKLIDEVKSKFYKDFRSVNTKDYEKYTENKNKFHKRKKPESQLIRQYEKENATTKTHSPKPDTDSPLQKTTSRTKIKK